MNIENRILEIYEEIDNLKKSILNLQEVSNASSELFGGGNVTIPKDGAHAGQSGWQSSNAWDIPAPIGTPVYAIASGTVQTFKDYGETPTHTNGKTLFGAGFTVDSDDGQPDVYYTHLKDVTIKQGDKIQCGQLLGYVMDFPGNNYDHLHIAVEKGNVKDFLNTDGTLKCANGETISGTSTSDNTSTTAPTTTNVTPSYSVSSPERDDFVFKTAKKLGSMFLPDVQKESVEINEQKNFGKGIQNRYGKIIIPGDLNPKIKSPISGVVYNKKFFGSCKNQITIKNEDEGKIYLQFCGIDTPLVRDGSSVYEGQTIGKTDSDVEVTLYDSSWNRIYIGDKFEVKKPKEKEEDDEKKKKTEKERYYSDPAVALMASLPGMAFNKIFGDKYDKKTGELKQKRWGGVADKKPVDPWVIDLIKKPFTKKVNEDIERIKKLLK
jgi:murein DD-endopeptidase MepM/ murein hydrolase activator NlpD